MSERVRIPGVPTLIARAAGGLGFTSESTSTWVDLSTWPPRLTERPEFTLTGVRGATGTWLAYVRRTDRWSLRWYATLDATAPAREEAQPASLGATADLRVESVHLFGDRALIVPNNVGIDPYHHPWLERGTAWIEETSLPPVDKATSAGRCPTACVRLGDGTDVLIWNGDVFRDDGGGLVKHVDHHLQLAWYHDHAPVAFGQRGLLACDHGRLVELDAHGVVPHLPGVTATSVHAGPGDTYVIDTSSVPLLWSPRDDSARELVPELLGRRCDVVGVAPAGGLVVYDPRSHELTCVSATDLQALPRRRASVAPIVAVPAPVAALDVSVSASRPRIAGVGEHVVMCAGAQLRFHMGPRAIGITHWASAIVAVAHDGRYVAALDARGTLCVLGALGGDLTVRVAGMPRSLAVGPDGMWLVVVAHGAWLVDPRAIAKRGKGLEPIAMSGALVAAVDPAGTVLLVGERRQLATWTAGVLTELPPSIEQIVACAPLGTGRFVCAGERHLFTLDVGAYELELLRRSMHKDEPDYFTTRTALLAASPDGSIIAWGATPTSIHIAKLTDGAFQIFDNVYYADEYTQPLDTPLALHGLAFTSPTTLAVALDHGRGNLLDLATRTASKLDGQIGDDASRWIFYFGGKQLIAE